MRPQGTRDLFPFRANSASPSGQHETFLDVFENAPEHDTLSTSVFSASGEHAKSDEHRGVLNFHAEDRFVVKRVPFCKSSFFRTGEGLIPKATGL